MKNSADLGECYPPRPSASVDNSLLDLQNSSYPTQPHSIIANCTMPNKHGTFARDFGAFLFLLVSTFLYFGAFLIKQLFYSHLLDMSRLKRLSIITQVILEILALSLAENGVTFRYNHLRRGDYSGRTNFQNSGNALCQCI